jgi:hypothetical protein
MKRGVVALGVVIIEFIKLTSRCYTLGVQDAMAVNIIPPNSKKNSNRQNGNKLGHWQDKGEGCINEQMM